MSFENPSFLKKKYNLQNSPEVLRAAVRYDKRKPSEEGSMINSKPEDKINNYLNRFKEISERKDEGEREMGMTALKKVLYKSLVIKEEDVPESYFRNQERLAREQGHGDIKVSEEQKKQLTEVIISDQKSSLDNWLDYLSSPDAMYPDWLKYYTIRSVSQLGKYNKEKKEFSKRNKNTTEPFIDINREALAYVLDAIIKKYEDAKGYKAKEVLENKYQEIEADNRLTDQEKEERKKEQAKFQEFLNNEDFAKLYAFAIEKVTPASKERLSDISGKWIKYERNSDHMPLVESLQGYGTGWCTAGESTAHAQLKGGDFYVYYSTDENGQPKIPRVAIRMEDDRIGEVRGIGPNQNLDPYISPVVSQKMEEFGTEGQKYQKKSADMKRLTEIDRRHKAGEDFSREDLKFLYQIDGRIEGFGYQEDPRIEELLAGRDKRNDLAYILDSKPEQISFSEEEALDSTRDIVFHYGNLFVDRIEYAQGLKLPNRINGSLVFNNLKSAEGLKLPKIVDGALSFSSLQSVKGLVLPDYIGESLSIHGVKSAKGLKLPNRVDYGISFTNLQSAEGLMLPDYIEKFLYLSSLESAKGLKLPNYVGGE